MTIDNDYITTTCAADSLHLSSAHVRRLCIDGQFVGAVKIGRDWLIPQISLQNFQRKKPGPKKKVKISNRDFLANVLKEVNKNGE